MEEVVSVFGRVPDGWIELQAVWLAKLLKPSVQRFAG
jgi:hypothetical protein